MIFSNKISVIIATLGGVQLHDTIKSINTNTIIPFEILICIPIQESYNITFQLPDNVKICISETRGQVAQRLFGFTLAQGEFIMQIDDDLILESNTIELLLNSLITLPNNSAIAPSIFVIQTKQSFYKRPPSTKGLNFYYFLINGMNGYKPGTLTKAMTNIGVDPDDSNELLTRSEWLPGGCVLHYRKNTINFNYFPFNGKAYCEDIYHSIYLTEKGINLFFHNTARIWLSETDIDYSLNEKFLNFLKDFKVRIYLAKKFPSGKSIFSIYLYYVINCYRFIFNKR